MSASASITCRVVDDMEGWNALQPHWERLLTDSPHSTPWQSWEFLSNWWRNMAEGNRLRLFVVERDARPCLILPLQISTWPWLPGIPVRMLEPIGMIMDVNRPRFALGAPEPEAYDCALAEIWQRRAEWHLIRIDEKPTDDPEVALLRRFAADHGLMFRQGFSHVCPYLDLDQPWESYLKTRSVRLRKNLRAAHRRLIALGPVTLRDFMSKEEIAQGFDVVLGLYGRSWKLKKKVEHNESAGYRNFYRGVLDSMAQRGRARILALYCGERAVAATIAFTNGSTYHSAQIVHDVEFAQCSPGTLLEAFELERLMNERRFKTYDFLGSFLNNKLRWTDTATPTTHVFVMHRSLANLIIDTYYFRLKPRVKPPLLRLLAKLGLYRSRT
jgi:CelD/BcsL family acetyltransferase involved in cellulose biosynthesis